MAEEKEAKPWESDAKSLGAVFADAFRRLLHPVFMLFVISWLAHNYRFVLLWCSGLPWAEKAALSEKMFFVGEGFVLDGIVVPLACVLFYIFVFTPFLAFLTKQYADQYRPLSKHSEEIRKGVEVIDKRVHEEVLRLELGKIETERDEALKSRNLSNDDVNRLRNRITELESEVRVLSDLKNVISPMMTKEAYRLAVLLDDIRIPVDARLVSANSGFGYDETIKVLSELRGLRWVVTSGRVEDPSYELSSHDKMAVEKLRTPIS